LKKRRLAERLSPFLGERTRLNVKKKLFEKKLDVRGYRLKLKFEKKLAEVEKNKLLLNVNQ